MADYTNDTEMAAYGRQSYRHRQINLAREAIRNAATRAQNANAEEGIVSIKAESEQAFKELLEAIKLC